MPRACRSSREPPCGWSRKALPGACASTIRMPGKAAAAAKASPHDRAGSFADKQVLPHPALGLVADLLDPQAARAVGSLVLDRLAHRRREQRRAELVEHGNAAGSGIRL